MPPAPSQDASSAGSTTRPAFVTPDSPPGAVNSKVMEKFLGFVASSKNGNFVNDHIRHAKRFRNPDLLEKLVAFMDVQEFGTNYPSDLYDPSARHTVTHAFAPCSLARRQSTLWKANDQSIA